MALKVAWPHAPPILLNQLHDMPEELQDQRITVAHDEHWLHAQLDVVPSHLVSTTSWSGPGRRRGGPQPWEFKVD
eukprot:CAMPEP_0204594422 /NCGR_PEP_ID=MMETSP0661-20131031/52070_1 /ASSEMBLY_ACC=CAM_ASM_000606 /TAXON_ID=109239 /ORGANISM="Alexandrium margalefi, Strain AMGDE01CS-322" /LENGTH=74 /DNA_ID=CAMNT_0051604815 /DNA_START=231 /DNA_END=452 /DNA_ORIENTATION=-